MADFFKIKKGRRETPTSEVRGGSPHKKKTSRIHLEVPKSDDKKEAKKTKQGAFGMIL